MANEHGKETVNSHAAPSLDDSEFWGRYTKALGKIESIFWPASFGNVPAIYQKST